MKPGESALRTGVLPHGHDLDQGHHRDGVEEMEPDDPVRTGCRRLGDGRHGQRAGVRRQDRVGRGLGVEGAEDRLFEAQVLERRLDDQRRFGGQAVERVGMAESGKPAVDPVLDRVGVEVEPRCAATEPVTNAVARSVDRLGVDIVDDHFPTAFERHLGDPRTHQSRADDPDDGHTDFIASNGWRHPRQ